MRIVVVAVGRVKERDMRGLVDDYLGRVRRHVPCEEIELTDGPPAKLVPAMQKALAGANVVAMEVTGRALDSPTFARGLERLGSRGKGVIGFVIGGADGIPAEVSRAAEERWSLSALTFPHRLARLVLAEQLYRGMAILRGEPYPH